MKVTQRGVPTWQAGAVNAPDPRHGVVLRRWGRFVARHAKAVLAFWLLFIVGGFVLSSGALGNEGLFSRLDSGEIVVAGENQDGRAVLTEAGASGFSTYTLLVEGVDLTDPAVATAAGAAVKELTAIDRVESAVNPFVVPGGPTGDVGRSFVGTKPGSFATVVTFDPENTAAQEDAATAEVDKVFDTLVTASGATSSERGGLRSLVDRIIAQIKIDGQRGEGIALPVSFVVMVVVFGGFLAAGLPILGAIASISGALISLLGFSYLLDLDATVVNVITVLGLGLCIDYGLLVVSRFREELRGLMAAAGSRGVSRDLVLHAVELTVDRAGRTVIFSALTVAISLGGLFVFDIDFIRAVSAAGVSIVVVALAVGISLIPALCALSGRRLLGKGTELSGDVGVFSRLAEFVHRVPWVIIGVVGAVLIVLALPSLSMRMTSSGGELLPVGTPERTFQEDFSTQYPVLAGAPVTIVTRAPLSEVAAFAAAAASRPGVVSVDAPVERDGIVTLGLRTGDTGTGDGSRELVASLRADRTPFESWTVGQASGISDYTDAVLDRAGYAVGLVALATLVLLFLMTGSIVIPIKALVMNILSLGATLGLVVWVFQEGHLEGLLRFASAGALESTIPLLVLAFGFGLSMDYEVFLLSRIVELHEQGEDTTRAVTLGLQRSGRIITSAALLMVIVFAGFAAADLLVMKQMGLALVVAIVIDATLVRMLLVPATMSVLGNANWWAPAGLRRLHEKWGITE